MHGTISVLETAVKDLQTLTSDEDVLADDLLWGLIEIARYLGRTPRQTAYLIEREAIPVRRLGRRTIIARKSQLAAITSTIDVEKLSAAKQARLTDEYGE
jgi:hypothetical protein